MALLFTLFLFTACTPSLITPSENIYGGDMGSVFAEVARVIGTQPYFENETGWVVDVNDQVGGHIKAHLSGDQCAFMGLSCEFKELGTLSITFVAKGEKQAAISISGGGRANDLIKRIYQTLEDKFGLLNKI